MRYSVLAKQETKQGLLWSILAATVSFVTRPRHADSYLVRVQKTWNPKEKEKTNYVVKLQIQVQTFVSIFIDMTLQKSKLCKGELRVWAIEPILQ